MLSVDKGVCMLSEDKGYVCCQRIRGMYAARG